MKSLTSAVTVLLFSFHVFAQVDTSFIYREGMPYGTLDIRIAKSPTDHYYLQRNKTFSFREVDGVRTGTYLDMTAWESSPYQQGNMREQNGDSTLFVMNYRLLVPEGYDPNFPGGYPLAILLHGSLERGNCDGTDCYHGTMDYSPNVNVPPAPESENSSLLNNDYNLVHGGSNFLEAHDLSEGRMPGDAVLNPRAFPGFVLFPQNLNGWDAGSAEDAIRLIRLVTREYNIDHNRIYLNGVSHGGHGAYEVMKRAPWLFAATVLFSAADDAQVVQDGVAGNIAGIPMWMFQGGKDTHPTPKKTEGYIAALRNAGARVRYTMYPELGHGTWNTAFSEPDFFSWMLRQKRNNIHVYGGTAVICNTSGYGASLTLPDGYPSYQWERDGQIIDGADSASFSATSPGAYRARFLFRMNDGGERWNEWSDVVVVSEKNLAPAKFKQIGTLALKDPNGIAIATLEADGDHAHYYWYRNGKPVNLPGNQDDTLKTAVLQPAIGNGAYTLRVAGYDKCLSPPSPQRHIFFNDSAPLNINPPSVLKLENISASEVHLTWQDGSGNEDAFEIWRRRKLSQDYALWEMVTLTPENATSFSDTSVLPSASYQYMIRAVSDSGRSAYYPDSSETPLIIDTFADHEDPSIPKDLVAVQVGVKDIALSWRPSADNSSVREYIIRYNKDSIATGSSDTTFHFNNIGVNTLYRFSVRAVDAGNNISDESNESEVYTSVNGLFYRHSTGAWQSLEEIDWSIAEFNGHVDDFTLAPKTQEDFFNFRFDGYVHVAAEGVYQMRISSNDGSRLFLDDSLLVENDGVHDFVTTMGPVQVLGTGPHRITVDFFDYTGPDTLLIEYKGPDSGNEWMKIPAGSLTSELITSIVQKEDTNFSFSVFPNPAPFNDIKLLLQSDVDSPVTIRIFDLAGKQVFHAEVDYSEQLEIRPSSYIEHGMYIVSIAQAGIALNKKIVIR